MVKGLILIPAKHLPLAEPGDKFTLRIMCGNNINLPTLCFLKALGESEEMCNKNSRVKDGVRFHSAYLSREIWQPVLTLTARGPTLVVRIGR